MQVPFLSWNGSLMYCSFLAFRVRRRLPDQQGGHSSEIYSRTRGRVAVAQTAFDPVLLEAGASKPGLVGGCANG